MIEFDVGKLVAELDLLFGLANRIEDKDTSLPGEGSIQVYNGACVQLDEAISGLDLKASKRALSRLFGNLTNRTGKFTRGDFKHYVGDLMLRLRDELELTNFIVVDGDSSKFYAQTEPLFGSKVATNYPSAYLEIEEAGKCLALGRSTACVFHLMRTLEVGIRAIANGLKIDDPAKPSQRNWGFILKNIKDAITNKPKWPRKRDREFYEESTAMLESVRNPWRNATMHVEKTYTDEEAENIFYAVRGFMMKIASNIDESGKRVKD